MESPISTPTLKDFQVAGISRSGRVRKKSSKLLDFESPEEIEKRTKRPGRQPARYPGRGRPPNALRGREPELPLEFDDADDFDMDNNHLSDMEHETATQMHRPIVGATVGLMNSDDEVDTLVQDLVEGVEAEASFTNDSRVRQSLYMREKSNKRKILKDGKLVTTKTQRKDKGKARFTAYSLWAREIRKRDIPDLDFANAARRLGELWANVSNKEKNAWRRKAKIQATKARTREKYATDAATVTSQLPSNGSSITHIDTNASNEATTTAAAAAFVNRATTSRTKKLAAERRQISELPTTPATTNRGRRANNSRGARGSPLVAASRQLGEVALPGDKNVQQQQQQQQQSSIEAIDAAAHLKLLGESLTVIGERLKEHNGHVALSGSLSVLLDSLLCSMGPLLCMTTQIPGLENKTQLTTNLASTLDNIAYVMPGL